MTERKVNTQIPVIFQNVEKYEKEDKRFLKVKIWLMHTGENLNGSSFSKEVVEKSLHSLANTPILAFLEDNSSGEQDFSDHRIVLHRNEDGDFNFKYLGSAIGVIPENNNAHWEKRVTDSGEEKEYLVVDGLMWTKWGEPTDIMNRKGITSQSMELADNYTGSFDDKGIFHFDSFDFFGACLLGDDVLPAMQSSTVEIQFSKVNNLQNTIENKLKEFYTLFSQQGGTGMEDNLTNVEQEVTEEKEIESTETVEQEFEEAKQPETKLDEVTEELAKDEVQPTEDSNEAPASTENATGDVEEEQTKDIIVDESPEEALEKREEESVEENGVELRATDSEPSEQTDFEAKYIELNEQFTSLQDEIKQLSDYKRQREEDDIKAKFADKLSEQEFKDVFESMKDADIQDVEDKLFALYGKKNFSISSTRTDTQLNKIKLALPKEENVEFNPYGDIFDK